jgi:hypothetical protein
MVAWAAVGAASGSVQAQPYSFEPDSVQAVLDRDKDCGDFDGLVDAQAHFLALQVIVGEGADPHRLDADGNGYACESLEANRIIRFSDDWWIRTVEVLDAVYCGPTAGLVEVRNFAQRMREAPFQQQEYLPTIDQAECLDTMYEIYSDPTQ